MSGGPARPREWIPPMELPPDRGAPAPAGADDGDGAPLPPAAPPSGGRWRFGTWAAAGVGAIAAVAVGFDTADLVARAFAASYALGVAVSALLGATGAALLGLLWREFRSLARLRSLDALRERAVRLEAAGGHGGASAWLSDLRAAWAGRPELAEAVRRLDLHVGDAHDDAEVLRLVERTVLEPADRRAYALVVRAARDTAVGTAVSPAALLDALIVLWRNLRLVRDVATLYGARPGYLGSVRLLRRMLENLAVAGVAESGDALVGEALGGGLAAALSSRVGQGILNGLLTARVGLAAMHLCRPVAFRPETRPSLSRIRRVLLEAPKDVL